MLMRKVRDEEALATRDGRYPEDRVEVLGGRRWLGHEGCAHPANSGIQRYVSLVEMRPN
jgi:hypothetical protein